MDSLVRRSVLLGFYCLARILASDVVGSEFILVSRPICFSLVEPDSKPMGSKGLLVDAGSRTGLTGIISGRQFSGEEFDFLFGVYVSFELLQVRGL